MAILEYEIGGNEVKRDASEAINDIPQNRSMVVAQLTDEAPVSPEAVTGLRDMDAVFAHYKPKVNVSFSDQQGQPVQESLKFGNVGDFDVRQITRQSNFLRDLSEQKDFYDTLVKQLRTNKVLQKALEDPKSKAAIIAALQSLKDELEANQN